MRAYTRSVSDRIRLGGMALENGVLVHSADHWACAVRMPDGEIKVASDRKRFRAPPGASKLVRGPLKLAEVFALLPAVRKKLPEAKLPYDRPGVLAAMVGGALAVHGIRRSALSPPAQEALAAVLAVAPAAVALRGTELAEYHGAEHISIGTYEHGEQREREHERCGSHLLGPLLLTSATGSLLASRVPAHLRLPARAGAAVGALAASVEIFSWMLRNENHPLARALARPGHELQHRFVTAEPTPEQLEVANATLAECLRLEASQPDEAAALQSSADGDRESGEAPPT